MHLIKIKLIGKNQNVPVYVGVTKNPGVPGRDIRTGFLIMTRLYCLMEVTGDIQKSGRT